MRWEGGERGTREGGETGRRRGQMQALWKVIHIACYIHSIKTLTLECFTIAYTNSPYMI